jgi:intracellular multiplication protein IcmL
MADETDEKAPNSRNVRPPTRTPSGGKKAALTKAESLDTGGVGRVVIRNEFYRDGYRLALRVAVIQCFIIFGLIGAMFFIIHVHQPENRYFATTEDGRLIPMVPLNQPNLSNPALLSWVAQAASETMSFSFSNYRRNLQEASRHFTRDGWESFSAALQQARIIESIEANTQEITAVPRGAPIIKWQGLSKDQYQWQVQIPMILTYVSGSKTRSDNWIITIVIVRVPRLESPNGVGIAQWIAVPG